MAPITALENQHVTLYYHPDTKIVHHIYHATIGGNYLKEALNVGVDLLREHSAVKWLSDNREIEGHSHEETEWINANWLPNAVDAGWKYWALVVPHSQMARINMSEFVNSFYNMGVRVMVFVNPDEAMTWLEEIG